MRTHQFDWRRIIPGFRISRRMATMNRVLILLILGVLTSQASAGVEATDDAGRIL